MNHNGSLAGKTAVVSGASSGMGHAIAEKLGGAGAVLHAVTRPIHINIAELVVPAREAARPVGSDHARDVPINHMNDVAAQSGRPLLATLRERDLGSR